MLKSECSRLKEAAEIASELRCANHFSFYVQPKEIFKSEVFLGLYKHFLNEAKDANTWYT